MKKFTLLFALMSLFGLGMSCSSDSKTEDKMENASQEMEDTGEDVKDSFEDAGENVEDSYEDAVD